MIPHSLVQRDKRYLYLDLDAVRARGAYLAVVAVFEVVLEPHSSFLPPVVEGGEAYPGDHDDEPLLLGQGVHNDGPIHYYEPVERHLAWMRSARALRAVAQRYVAASPAAVSYRDSVRNAVQRAAMPVVPARHVAEELSVSRCERSPRPSAVARAMRLGAAASA